MDVVAAAETTDEDPLDDCSSDQGKEEVDRGKGYKIRKQKTKTPKNLNFQNMQKDENLKIDSFEISSISIRVNHSDHE